MAAELALLPSPLLGPAVWMPVAEELRRTGWPVVACGGDGAAPRTWEDVLRSFLADLPAGRDLVLVPHSNAGLYVPALTGRRQVVASVFVDAGLPPTEGSTPLAPPDFYDFLATLADEDGVLPPWTQWWEGPDVDELFPNGAARDRVEQEQRRLPLAYFRDSLPVPAGWDHNPSAYIAFGDTYAQDREQAEGRGWPVRTLTGGHLHTLVEPSDVAAVITELVESLGVDPPRL